MMKSAFVALLAVFAAGPALSQSAETLLDQRRDSRLLDHRLGVDRAGPVIERRLRQQSEARQREWSGSVTPEYQRRLDRDGRAAANAWIRTEAERFDRGESGRARP